VTAARRDPAPDRPGLGTIPSTAVTSERIAVLREVRRILNSASNVAENSLVFGDPYTPRDSAEFTITMIAKADKFLELAEVLP